MQAIFEKIFTVKFSEWPKKKKNEKNSKISNARNFPENTKVKMTIFYSKNYSEQKKSES